MKTTALPPFECPHCRHRMEAATAVSPSARTPEPGDLSICIECGTFMEFEEGLTLKLFPDDRLLDLPDDARLELVRARRGILAMQERAQRSRDLCGND